MAEIYAEKSSPTRAPRREDLSDQLIAAASFCAKGVLGVLKSLEGCTDPELLGLDGEVLRRAWKDFKNPASHPAMFSVELMAQGKEITLKGFSGAWADLPEAVAASPVLFRRVSEWMREWAQANEVENVLIRDPYAVEIAEHPLAMCAEAAGLMAITQSPYAPIERTMANVGDVTVATPAALSLGIIECVESGTPTLFPLWTALLDEPGIHAAMFSFQQQTPLIPPRGCFGRFINEGESPSGSVSIRQTALIDIPNPPYFEPARQVSPSASKAKPKFFRAYCNVNGVAGLVEIDT